MENRVCSISFFSLLLLFWFDFQGQLAKKNDCCKQGPCKMVTWGHHCPQHLQAPALSGTGAALGTIPGGKTTEYPAPCDLFLYQKGLPAQLPVEQTGTPVIPWHGCTREWGKSPELLPVGRGRNKEVEEEEKLSKAAAGEYQGEGGYEPLLAVEGC